MQSFLAETHGLVDKRKDETVMEAPSTGHSPRVYGRRWYILTVFALLEFVQCLVWSAFGPIAFAVKFAYEWSDATFAMMLNWGCIAFLFFLAPLSAYLARHGLRRTTLLVSALVAAGSCLRLLGRHDDRHFLWAAHLGSILNGVAGVTLGSAPPVVSATWFPEDERIFATSVNLGANLLGSGAAYYFGPRLVPFDHTANNKSSLGPDELTSSVNDLRDVIHNYLRTHAISALLLLAVIFLYFPPSPPTPVSATAAASRPRHKSGQDNGWTKILSDPQMWLVSLANAVPSGMLTSWQNLMGLNFGPLGVSDAEIGHIGFVSIFVQTIAASALAFVQDKLPRERMRTSLVALLCGALFCFAWLAGLCLGRLPFSLGQLYAATILGVTLSYSTVPIFYEYAVALAPPSSSSSSSAEVLVGGLMSGAVNATTGVFLLVFFLPGIGTDWMNWGLCLTTAAAVPAVLRTRLPQAATAHEVKLA